jgi:hypothetical protein
VVDRSRQAGEEVVQGGRVGGVERCGAVRTDFGRRKGEPIGVAPGEDDVGSFGAGSSGGLKADASRTTDADDGLSEQFGSALRGRRCRLTAHDLSRSVCSTHVDTSAQDAQAVLPVVIQRNRPGVLVSHPPGCISSTADSSKNRPKFDQGTSRVIGDRIAAADDGNGRQSLP